MSMCKRFWVVFCLCLLSQLCWALEGNSQDGPHESVVAPSLDCDQDCVEVGTWYVSLGLGVGFRSNPLEGGDDIPLVVLPEVSYYGKRFFFRNLEFGYTLFEDRHHQLNMLVAPSYDQMYFNRWDILNFTDSAGVAGSSVSYPPPPTYSPVYTVNVAAANAVGVGPEDIKDAEASSGGGSSGARAPDDEYIPLAPSPVPAVDPIQFDNIGSVQINGVSIQLTSSSLISGRVIEGVSGNDIQISINAGVVDISGVSSGDIVSFDPAKEGGQRTRVELGGDGFSIQEQRQEELTSATAEGSGVGGKLNINDLNERKMAGMAGFEYMYSRPRYHLHFQALTDFTQVHGGHELRFSAILPFQVENNYWAFTLGLNYQSHQVLDYYYGVDASEAPSPSWVFSPSSAGVSKLLRLDWQRPLSRHWSLRAMIQYSVLAEEIHSSPIVAEPNINSVFFGGVYHF